MCSHANSAIDARNVNDVYGCAVHMFSFHMGAVYTRHSLRDATPSESTSDQSVFFPKEMLFHSGRRHAKLPEVQ